MRLRSNIFFLGFFAVIPLCAAEWKLDSAGFHFDSSAGRGRIEGPLKLDYGEWKLTCLREGFISSDGKILKQPSTGGKADYRVESSPARIVLLGNARLGKGEAPAVLEGSFLVLDMTKRTVTSAGAGLVVRTRGRVLRSTAEDATVSIELGSGEATLTGAGWETADE